MNTETDPLFIATTEVGNWSNAKSVAVVVTVTWLVVTAKRMPPEAQRTSAVNRSLLTICLIYNPFLTSVARVARSSR